MSVVMETERCLRQVADESVQDMPNSHNVIDLNPTAARPKGQAVAAPRVLLTDTNRWPGAARLAIILAKAGCEVSAVCPAYGHPLQKTSAVRHTHRYSGVRPIESLVKAIRKVAPH